MVTEVLNNKDFSTFQRLLLLDFLNLLEIISIYRRFKRFGSFFRSSVTDGFLNASFFYIYYANERIEYFRKTVTQFRVINRQNVGFFSSSVTFSLRELLPY